MRKKYYCLDCNKEKSGKGLYCKKCGYNHRTRPIGLKYKIIAVNKGWFKKGFTPWNLGVKGYTNNTKGRRKGIRFSPETEFKYKNGTGYRHTIFKAKGFACEECRKEFPKSRLHVHHVDKNRKNNNIDNLAIYCRPCHLAIHGRKERITGYEPKRKELPK